MALRTFHSGTFNFLDRNIRVEGSTTSGGQSLSGIDDPIRTDGGGYVVADFSNGAMIDRETNLAWRALTTGMDGGATAVVVYFCDRRHQPAGKRESVPHDDNQPFDDLSPYQSAATSSAIADAANLRAVTIVLSAKDTAIPLIAGEWFSIQHPSWGWRAYNIIAIYDNVIEFRPPLREAIPDGTTLEFDEACCTMRVAAVPSRAISGRLGQAQITFVEDMRKPS